MEIEAKLGVPDAAALRRLAGLRTLAGFDLRPRGASVVRDTYLDTRRRLLRAAGLACRRRASAGGVLYTVKALAGASGAVHRREELELRLRRDAPPAAWSRGRARARVLAVAGREPLEPIVELEQRRVKRTALAGRRVVAEVSLDTVRVPSRDGERVFYEVEIELIRSGTERDLAAMVAELRERWGAADVTGSKLERALAIAGTAGAGRSGGRARRPPRRGVAAAGTTDVPAAAERPRPQVPRLERPGLTPATPMAEAARRTLAVHFGRMLDHEAGTRLGEDPEELHDMRVATRRLRAAQRLFAPHLDRDAMRPLRKALRRTGRALGAVRDLDVFHEKTAWYLEALPETRRGELAPLLGFLGRTRDAARRELLAHLDGEEYRVFCERFAAFLSSPAAGAPSPAGREAPPLLREVRHVVPAELLRHYGEVLTFDAPLAAPEPPLGCYHLLRITAKRFRYTLEFFTEVLGDETKGMIRDVKALQDHLGNLQDAVVASALLSDFLRKGTWDKSGPGRAAARVRVAPGVAAYLAARQSELQGLLDGFPPVWGRVRGRAFGARLGALASALAVPGTPEPAP